MLIGMDHTLDTMWIDTWDEEVERLIHPEDGQDICSLIEQCMLYRVAVWPSNMQTLNTAALTNLGEVEYVCYSQPSYI